ncbi:hypothetical protein F5Y04DRAFT_246815 [Hypomontagnella monticulosa]|nr:hypothetical protein F5Y04DRAFT_246815 [Hypomontagnella monticulosa]
MDSQSTTPEILNTILSTLQRLETRLENHDGRLNGIECSMLSAADASPAMSPERAYSPFRTPAGHNLFHPISKPGNYYQNPLEEHPAAAYMASVMKLRSRFEADSRSEFGIPGTDERGTIADTDNDWCSMSIYSSRPLSRLRLDVLDVPPVPSIPQDFQQTAQEPRLSEYPNGSTNLLAMRYEDAPESPASAASSSPRDSLSENRRSTSTAPTSIAPASPSAESKRSLERLESPLRALMNRSTSLRSKNKGRSSAELSRLDAMPEEPSSIVIHVEISGNRVYQNIRRTGKSCVMFVPNIVTHIGRWMMSQQLKMLDNRT